jgi:hypothetical protein
MGLIHKQAGLDMKSRITEYVENLISEYKKTNQYIHYRTLFGGDLLDDSFELGDDYVVNINPRTTREFFEVLEWLYAKHEVLPEFLMIRFPKEVSVHDFREQHETEYTKVLNYFDRWIAGLEEFEIVKLIIPKSCYVRPDGTERVLREESKFAYIIGKTDSGKWEYTKFI